MTVSNPRLHRFCLSHTSVFHDIPDGCWTRDALNEQAESLFRKMRSRNVVEPVGEVRVRPDKKKRVWRLTKDAKSVLDCYNGWSMMPCGHNGFTNEEGSDFYICTRCNARFLREDLE